jgi:pimeloyl-ACP methyl ester carboxylesterase
MPFLERDGVGISYALHGRPSDRMPLLLTHGFGATAEMWAPNLPALSADRLVITWDLRGHGHSDAPDDQAAYSHAASVADMAALLDAAEAPRAVIGGMSLGGFLSLSFHVEHPERVVALLLVDTGPGYRSDRARAEWNAYAERTASDLDARGLAALPYSPEQAHARHDHGAAGIARVARGILPQRDARVIESLPDIAVPALVVVGALDTNFLAAADAMAERIPGAQKIVIDDAGHAANMDRPEEFDRAVLDFLEAT